MCGSSPLCSGAFVVCLRRSRCRPDGGAGRTARGFGRVWVVRVCGFWVGKAGGPAARWCEYFSGRRWGCPVCWGFAFGLGEWVFALFLFCALFLWSLVMCFAVLCQLSLSCACASIRGRFRHASFLRVTHTPSIRARSDATASCPAVPYPQLRSIHVTQTLALRGPHYSHASIA